MGTEDTVVAGEGEKPDETTDAGTVQDPEDGSQKVEDADDDKGAAAEDEDTEGADAIRKDEIKGLTEEAQTAVNKRINKIVAREKTAVERAEAAETELETARTKLEGGFPEMVKRLGLHGELLSPAEAQKLSRYTELRGQKEWCRAHEEDGYEGKGGDDPSVNAADVRRKLSQIEDELDELTPSVGAIKTRIDKEAREIWKAGREALAKKGKDGDRKKPVTTPKKVIKPPVIPGGAAAPKAPASAKKAQGNFSKDEFIKDGADPAALEKQFSKIF